MLKKIVISTFLILVLTLAAAGCNQPTQPTGPTTTDVNNKVDQVIKEGLPGFGPAMRGVSDSFDNMYYAAKGGNWGLAAYMGDVMNDYMAPDKISRPQYYPQWDSFYKANLGDNSSLRKAMAAKDFKAFDAAYSDTINKGCNTCHEGMGFKFIKKVKASAPEANIDYTVQSNASDNK